MSVVSSSPDQLFYSQKICFHYSTKFQKNFNTLSSKESQWNSMEPHRNECIKKCQVSTSFKWCLFYSFAQFYNHFHWLMLFLDMFHTEITKVKQNPNPSKCVMGLSVFSFEAPETGCWCCQIKSFLVFFGNRRLIWICVPKIKRFKDNLLQPRKSAQNWKNTQAIAFTFFQKWAKI